MLPPRGRSRGRKTTVRTRRRGCHAPSHPPNAAVTGRRVYDAVAASGCATAPSMRAPVRRTTRQRRAEHAVAPGPAVACGSRPNASTVCGACSSDGDGYSSRGVPSPCPATAHRSTDFRGSGTSVAFPSVGQRGALRTCDRDCRDSASASVIAPASGHSRIRVNPAVRVTRVMGWPPPAPPSGLRLESPLGGAVQRALVCRRFEGWLVGSIVIG